MTAHHRPIKRLLTITALATLLGTAMINGALATPITFNASGTFKSGATLGGTITIDTASGTVVSADLALSAPYNAVENNDESYGDGYQSYFGFYLLNIDPGYRAQGGSNVLEFSLPVTTLVSYGGGMLYSLDNNASLTGHPVSTNIDSDSLVSGSFTEVLVPEPGSLLLLGTGLIGLGLVMRKRRKSA